MITIEGCFTLLSSISPLPRSLDGGRAEMAEGGGLLALSTACALFTVPPTVLLIRSHLRAWERPELQLRVVRIVLMVKRRQQEARSGRGRGGEGAK
eukprot:scaffold145142_cov31-Tisochrysis_lutea.AAC.4